MLTVPTVQKNMDIITSLRWRKCNYRSWSRGAWLPVSAGMTSRIEESQAVPLPKQETPDRGLLRKRKTRQREWISGLSRMGFWGSCWVCFRSKVAIQIPTNFCWSVFFLHHV